MSTFECPRSPRAVATLVLLLCLTVNPVGASQKSPEEVFEGRPSNLDILPQGAISTRPIRLVVSFNLEFERNTTEAEQFLETWYTSISALPDRADLQLQRQVSPARYTYAVALTFRNWEEYRIYESRPEFLDYYY